MPPFGFLQNLADLVKLVSKENMVPDRADKPLYQTILPAVVALFVLILAFIPFTNAFVGIDSSIGLFAVFVLISFSPLLLFLAGWTSGNKFGSISAQRSVMVMISYEVPMFLVIIAVAMLSNGYSLVSVVGAQSGYWFALLMPIGLVIFFIVMLAELERPPFDLREADSELVAGWLTDASAPYYALALMLDYVRMFVGALLITLLFFGGWLYVHSPSIRLADRKGAAADSLHSDNKGDKRAHAHRQRAEAGLDIPHPACGAQSSSHIYSLC